MTGLGVTAVIQSSSTTTVMVVGFVNFGLMTLRQAINMVMGANVGTTVRIKSTINLPKGDVPMLNQDYTAKLLDLEDVTVTNVEYISNELHIYLKLPHVAHVCPACGAATAIVHEGVPLARDTFLHLRKRRYCCVCGKRFFEKNDFLTRYQRVTTRLPTAISIDEFKGNSGGHKYNSLIVDPEHRQITNVLPNRYESNLIRYFSKFESRKGGKILHL